MQQLLQWVVPSADEVRAEFDLMTVIISDKALLIISLLVYHGGCLLMLLPVVSAQTGNDKSSLSVTPMTGHNTIDAQTGQL